MLDLDRGKGNGVLLVGANSWTIAFAEFVKSQDREVLIADEDKLALRRARRVEIPVHHGNILDEAHEDEIELGQYRQLIAATGSDSYNALVCSELAPEIGADRVSRTGGQSRLKGLRRGRIFTLAGTSIEELLDRLQAGWTFGRTRITEKFTYEDFVVRMKANGGDSLAVAKASGDLVIFSSDRRPAVEVDDVIWTFVPPEGPAKPVSSPITGSAEIAA